MNLAASKHSPAPCIGVVCGFVVSGNYWAFLLSFPSGHTRKAVCEVPRASLLMQQCCQVSICLSVHLEDMKLLAGGGGRARKLKNNPKKVMCVFQNLHLIEKGFLS